MSNVITKSAIANIDLLVLEVLCNNEISVNSKEFTDAMEFQKIYSECQKDTGYILNFTDLKVEQITDSSIEQSLGKKVYYMLNGECMPLDNYLLNQ